MNEFASGQFIDAQRSKVAEADQQLRQCKIGLREVAARSLQQRDQIQMLKKKNESLRIDKAGLLVKVAELEQACIKLSETEEEEEAVEQEVPSDE
jgi:hypothetical protein